MTMVVTPSSASPSVMLPMLRTMLVQVSINSLPDPGSPSRDLIWLLEMVMAAAVVKPTITGIDTKSTRKPEMFS